MSAAVGTTSASEVQERSFAVWQERVRIRVLSKGRGPSLVFFHGPWGLTWDPFLDELAQHFTVYAPEHPGTTPDAQDDVYHLDGLWDLVLCYDELMSALGITSAVLVGHSFGGMVAAEIAAVFPARVKSLTLASPLGLWRDDAPSADILILPADELAAVLWRDPASRVALDWAAGSGGDPDDIAAQVESLQRRSSMAKFVWPIPDKGLHRRLHRVAAPTLLVWGDDDRANPVIYAEEWQRRVKGAALRLLPGGHMGLHEAPEAAARAVVELAGP
jgi:pimeloyl-ACP methyl ester carboxylesterase